MPIDAIELHLASALQRFNALQRRAEAHRDPAALLTKTFAELGSALEELRVAQDQLVEQRGHMERLQSQLQQQDERYWQLFDEMPNAYVVTNAETVITEVNRAAAQLFNVSQRFLVNKALSVFVCEDRARFLRNAAAVAAEGGERNLNVRLRPRERAPLSVIAHVGGDAGGLRWVLRPVAEPAAVPTL